MQIWVERKKHALFVGRETEKRATLRGWDAMRIGGRLVTCLVVEGSRQMDAVGVW